jgi:hypothetical protein
MMQRSGREQIPYRKEMRIVPFDLRFMWSFVHERGSEQKREGLKCFSFRAFARIIFRVHHKNLQLLSDCIHSQFVVHGICRSVVLYGSSERRYTRLRHQPPPLLSCPRDAFSVTLIPCSDVASSAKPSNTAPSLVKRKIGKSTSKSVSFSTLATELCKCGLTNM